MTAPFHAWLAEPLAPAVAASIDRLRAAGDVVHVVAMPDVHLAEDVCVGLVVATTRRIYPSAVGGDIGCGVSAIRLDGAADALSDESAAARVLTGLGRAIPVLVRERSAMDDPLPGGLEDLPLSAPNLETRRRRDGRIEFGTVGRGNHFVEILADDDDALWLMAHSGSRAMGGAIRDHHLRACARDATGLAHLDADGDAGCAYLHDHAWALRYADANRRALLEAAAVVLERVLGVRALADGSVSCAHNHVGRETHVQGDLWVHRKGAIPAAEGEPGIIPGSMGTSSFLTLGRGEPASLRSSSHGAGRAMSRAEARRRIRVRDLERDARGVWFDHRIARRLVEEAPAAYRDIGRVMRAQRDLTRIVRRLRPLLSFKGA